MAPSAQAGRESWPIQSSFREPWSGRGENPGISLKETPDGPFVALASFFRVVLSPHGRGHALVLLQSPQDARSPAERGNFCLHDNEPLARYLVTEFVAHFGAFKGLAGLGSLTYQPLDSVEATGDPASSYSETVRAESERASHLERPRQAALLRPAAAPIGHRPAPHAEPVRRPPGAMVTVNGRALPASPCRARSPGTASRPPCSPFRRPGSAPASVPRPGEVVQTLVAGKRRAEAALCRPARAPHLADGDSTGRNPSASRPSWALPRPLRLAGGPVRSLPAYAGEALSLRAGDSGGSLA